MLAARLRRRGGREVDGKAINGDRDSG